MLTSVLDFAMGAAITPIGLLVTGAAVMFAVPKLVSKLYTEYQVLQAKLSTKLAAEVKAVEVKLHLSSVDAIVAGVEAKIKEMFFSAQAPAPVPVVIPSAAMPAVVVPLPVQAQNNTITT